MRSRKRDARRALLIGAFVYVAMQGLLSLALATTLSELRSPIYEYKKSRLETRLKTDDPRALKVVMLGSSRVLQGLRSDHVEAALKDRLPRPVVVYNFGVAGAGPFTQMLYLRRMLADGIRPDLVLMEIMPVLLGDSPAPRDAGEKPLPLEHLRRDELAIVQRYAGDTRQVRESDWWLTWAYPAHAHRSALVSHSVPILVSQSQRFNLLRDDGPTGWVPFKKWNWSEERQRALVEYARKQYEEALAHFEPKPMPTAALREGLDLCRESGIPVTLVTMPEGPTFRSWYPAVTKEKIKTLLEEVTRTYRIPHIDASAWLEGEELFADSHHLLPEGAAEFSRLLAERVLLHLLAEPRTVSSQ